MNIYGSIGIVLGIFFVVTMIFLAPKVRAWLEARAGQAETDELWTLIQAFVQAADQMFHDSDPDGRKRMQFVLEQLESVGIEITEAVINMIEGAVWVVNMASRQLADAGRGEPA